MLYNIDINTRSAKSIIKTIIVVLSVSQAHTGGIL